MQVGPDTPIGVLGRARKALRFAAVLVGSLALAGAFVIATPVSPAEAAISDGFNAGNIISDGNFYDGTSMSVEEVQRFLNQRVPDCWLGRPGYEIGKPVYWGGPTKLASKCLKDFRITTSSILADAYCSGVPGIANETAASVIVRIGKACGISPKVLLVMLDKEQSLVSDPWPNENQYFMAMGYACPDTGPGGTGQCDPTQGGFAKQVYRAAWQYKVYKAFPNSYGYKAGQNNVILWHPDQRLGCGSSQVYIENAATAALYIYTPYRPNQAALDAGWGTGDQCSSYGNRNFYNYFKAWFGSPNGPVTDELFLPLYRQLGGAEGVLGEATSGLIRYAAGGRAQAFSGGSMYWTPDTGSAAVFAGPLLDRFWAEGSVGGALGFPIKTTITYPNSGLGQAFQYGSIYFSPRTGSSILQSEVRQKYWDAGSVSGRLGYPKSKTASYSDGGKGHAFEHGSIYWQQGIGAFIVEGSVLERFWADGSVVGPLGYPTSDLVNYPDGGIAQVFQGGSIYRGPESYAWGVLGSIRDQYWLKGSKSGVLGYPISGTKVYDDGGVGQQFAGGAIYASSMTDRAYAITDGVLARYWAVGSAVGPLGYPTSGIINYLDGGVAQVFQGGSIYQAPGGGAWEVTGAIRDRYWSLGSASGKLGYPIEAAVSNLDGVVSQKFQRGTIQLETEPETTDPAN